MIEDGSTRGVSGPVDSSTPIVLCVLMDSEDRSRWARQSAPVNTEPLCRSVAGGQVHPVVVQTHRTHDRLRMVGRRDPVDDHRGFETCQPTATVRSRRTLLDVQRVTLFCRYRSETTAKNISVYGRKKTPGERSPIDLVGGYTTGTTKDLY